MTKLWPALLCLCLCACDAPAPRAADAPSSPSASAPSQGLPPGHPPVSSGQAPSGPGHDQALADMIKQPAAPDGPAKAGGLTWEAGAPLERQTPKSSMRAAQYVVTGDARAELAVFFFGSGQGGSVDANITRWLGQLQQADGSDTASKAKRSERKVGDIAVSLVEAQGAYGGGMAMPGAPAPESISDAMLLGAIAQGPEGAVFFKLVGPRDAVERARPAFDAMIGSLRKAP